jgi:hypothetical protein
MSEHLSTILEQATARLEAGESVEAILADYPSQRDKLAPLLEAAQQVSSLRTRPPSTQPEAGLSAFLDEAQEARAEPALRGWLERWLMRQFAAIRDWWWYPWTRSTVGALAAVVLLFALVFGVTSLAADSLPGEPFYTVKLVGEEVRLALTFNVGSRVDRLLYQARTRSLEIQRLAQTGRQIPDGTLGRLNQALEDSLMAAASAQLSEMPRLLQAIEGTTDQQAGFLAAVDATSLSVGGRHALNRATLSLVKTRAIAHVGQADLDTFRLNSQLGSFGLEWPSEIPP